MRRQQPERGWAVQRQGEVEAMFGGVCAPEGLLRTTAEGGEPEGQALGLRRVVGGVAAAWLGAVALTMAVCSAIPTLHRAACVCGPCLGTVSRQLVELLAEG